MKGMARFFLYVLTGLLLAVPAWAQTNRPNLVVILADDLGWGDVGFNGRTEWATPNLDKLAQSGTTFKRWYTSAVVCAPSRAALMTGRYTIHCGVSGNGGDVPASETTLAEALRPLGYRTALFGKWHGGKPRDGGKDSLHPFEQGFDEFVGFRNAKHAWEHFPKELWFGRELKPVPTNTYTATFFTDHAVDFVAKHTNDPFFLYLAFTEPHLHVEAPAEDVRRYEGKFPEEDPAQPHRARYAAMISRMDAEVGRFLAKLDELNLSSNTLVVFSSDHGATFEVGNKGAAAFHDSNRPFRGQKRTLWEGGVRVPGIARWPGHIPAGSISTNVTVMMDVLPTLLAAAGTKPEAAWQVDGVNQLPVWTGQAQPAARTVFWEWRTEGNYQLAAMQDDWKLVITGQNQPELFNVVADPAERRNRAAEKPALAKHLEKDLKAWLATEAETAKKDQ